MYTMEDLTTIQGQKKKRCILLAVPSILLLLVVLVSFLLRIQWLTITATIVVGVLLIAGYDLGIKPIRAYELHLRNVLLGETHELVCIFDHLSTDVSNVDDVRYYSLIVLDRDDKGRPYERLFYVDCEKKLPDIQKGERVSIVYHDHVLANLSRV